MLKGRVTLLRWGHNQIGAFFLVVVFLSPSVLRMKEKKASK